ncbi:PfkB family carbohydrate kinase [Kovacikia minuta CCNUW1]|uniref:bifunctional heptose 7-phosphate kinase/heptose 1-phosphate adenyltransferase n=1 Tax=Kovacikia minuta TaxID=2931930 RepID=UPI001CCE3D83|nr:PfkB family carbohydrate kinase [Kovacikia minuta]UBF26523.1 PfkB family carbohydrate kinase [Kovacikia minuta CCNUW1]
MPPTLSGLIQSFSRLHIAVIGEAILDSYLMGNADRLCAEAPVPVVTLNDRQDVPGGAANTAVNLRSLGAQVSFLSVVGADLEGSLLFRALERQGISTDALITQSSRCTLVKHRIMAGSQMLMRFDQGNTDAIGSDIENLLIDRLSHLFARCDAILISDYSYGILTPQVIAAIAQLQARSPQLIVVDSKRLANYRSVGVTVVKPNYKEAIQLLGIQNIHDASGDQFFDQGTRIDQILLHQKQLLDRTGARIAAVTLDTDGALMLQHHAAPLQVPARSKTCASATGAGDTFISALTLALAAGASVSAAGELASSAAAVVVAKAGTATCSIEELQARLAMTETQFETRRGKEPLRPNTTPERNGNESSREVA